MRSILFSLILTFSLLAPLAAQTMPEIPHSRRILSVEEVKNYWVNRLPEPREPSRLKSSYSGLMVQYHEQVGSRHRLIQAIRGGWYDQLARIAMLRHNIVAYQLLGDEDKVLALSAELAELEAVDRMAAEERANAQRLERLIAATERLAAAIEKNGGIVPDDAQHLVEEIVPFERDRNDRRSIITHLHDEIEICNQPIIIHDHSNYHPSRPVIVHDHSTHTRPSSRPTQAQAHLRPAKKTQPQQRQPQVRPQMPQQPQVRPATAPSQPAVRQPQVPSIRR